MWQPRKAGAIPFPVYVINLDRSAERLRAIDARLSELSIPYVRIAAVDGLAMSPTERDRTSGQTALERLGRPLLPGEVGCFLSHRLAARAFLDTGEPVGLVLEDDAALTDDLRDVLHRLRQIETESWDVINLGRPPKRFATPHPGLPGLFRAHYFPVTTTALVWTRAGAGRFVKAVERFDLPVDRFLQEWCVANDSGLAMAVPPVGTTGADSEIELLVPRRRRRRRSRNGVRRVARQAVNNWRAFRHWLRWRRGIALPDRDFSRRAPR